MAHFVFTNPKVTINAVDLSDHVRSVTLNYSAAMVDDTCAGDTTQIRLGGLKDWSVDLTMGNDFAAGEVDATLFPLVGTTFTVAIQPVNTTISATNPNYTGTGILESYPPIAGSIGDLAETSVTIQAAGTLSRATA